MFLLGRQLTFNDSEDEEEEEEIEDQEKTTIYQESRDIYHSVHDSENDSGTEFDEDEFEEEEDELVEDQLLPDSELKTGLELLFLKQQRHYWNQRKRHERSNLQ